MSMLRGDDLQSAWSTRRALPSADPDLLAGPFAHVVVDEAQELTDAEWQMLLLRCPSRSLTIVGDRAQARHGFTESWQERLERVGLDRVDAGVADHQLPHAGGGDGRGRAGHPRGASPTPTCRPRSAAAACPVAHGPDRRAATRSSRPGWREHAEGVAVRDRRPDASTATAAGRGRSRPELAKGLEFDLVVLVDPDAFGDGIEGAVDRYVAMTRATQQLVVLTSP